MGSSDLSRPAAKKNRERAVPRTAGLERKNCEEPMVPPPYGSSFDCENVDTQQAICPQTQEDKLHAPKSTRAREDGGLDDLIQGKPKKCKVCHTDIKD